MNTEQHVFRIGRIISHNSDKYKVIELIDYGNSGDVYKVECKERVFALKVFIPRYQWNLFSTKALNKRSINESIEYQTKEYKFLSSLSHPNIVKVHFDLNIDLLDSERKFNLSEVRTVPAILMEWVNGKPLKDAIEEFNLNADQVANIFLQLSHAIHYLHNSQQYLHTDIKSKNILIRENTFETVLIDFALCKNFNFSKVNPNELTKLEGDWDLFPKLDQNHPLKKIKETNGTREDIKKQAFPFLDLFQFGKLIKEELLDKLDKKFNLRELDYLNELCEQLIDWEIVKRWSTQDLISRITRLKPDHFTVFGIPELSTAFSEKTLIIPPNISCPLTNYIEQIITNRSFRRLFLINQLCLVSYIYPAADYKRSVHVFHSYNLSRQLITQLYSSSLFRVLFDKKGAQQLLATALLHDINHFPFLHIFQESKIPGIDRIKTLDLFCNGEATGEKSRGKPSIYNLLEEVGVDSQRFYKLVFGKHHEQEGNHVEIDQAINSILNSGVDIDKLSYLFLDSYFTGVSYGTGIDFPCILKAATLKKLDNKKIHLCFTDRAIQALENVVMTRFWNFRSIYWHHTNRALMAMILFVVKKLYIEANLKVENYLKDTMWFTDYEAIRYLDAQYLKHFDKTSILKNIIEDRGTLYKRIYTVHAGMKDPVDDDLFNKLRKLSNEQEITFRLFLADALGATFSIHGKKIVVDEEEVLIDIPQREMDSGGDVFIDSLKGQIFALIDISNPIRAINDNYERLTKRARIFTSPRILNIIGKQYRIDNHTVLQKLIKECLDKTLGSSQVI